MTKTYTYTPSGMLATYTSGNDSQVNMYNGDGQRIRKTEGSDVTNYFYTEDMRGSTVNIIDSSAGQVAFYWYSDFGEVTEAKAASYSNFVNEIQYTGAVCDELTGLQ